VTENEFNQKVDDTLAAIEESLDHCAADLDWDLSGGILTIECDNGSQVILNRQTPSRQIWVAARSGGYHFDYQADDDSWHQGELELLALVSQALSEQSGETVTL
jgi:CyaY protein